MVILFTRALSLLRALVDGVAALPRSTKSAHEMQHLKGTFFELILHLTSASLFCTPFTLHLHLFDCTSFVVNGEARDELLKANGLSVHHKDWDVWFRCPRRLEVYLRSKALLCTSNTEVWLR